MNENEIYINADEFSTILDTMYDSDVADDYDDYIDGYIVGFNDAILAVLKRLDTMPKIDIASVKQGKWIWKDNYRDYDGYICSTYSCSNCGEIINTANLGKTPYCPKCGSKMSNGDDTE